MRDYVNALTIDGPSLMKRCTLQVRFKRWRQVRARIWLMVKLIQLAALVGGVGIEIESEP